MILKMKLMIVMMVKGDYKNYEKNTLQIVHSMLCHHIIFLLNRIADQDPTSKSSTVLTEIY